MQIALPRQNQRPWPPFTRLISVVVAATLLFGAGTFVYHRVNPGPAPVVQQTAQVTRGTITSSVNATGNVASTQSSRLTFRSDGTVSEVNVSVGDSVIAGQVLAKLDSTQLDLAVQQAQAQLASAQAKLDQELGGARPEDITIAQAD